MQQHITELKYTTPPWVSPINIDEPNWVGSTLRFIFQRMLEIAYREPKGGRLRRVFDQLAYVVINYRSMRTSGQLGQRHAITLGNIEHIHLGAGSLNPVSRLDGSPDQIDIVFFETGSPNLREVQGKRASWISGWSDYLSLGEWQRPTTLGALHLGTAPKPRPLFISWFELTSGRAPRGAGPGAGLTPIAVNIQKKDTPPNGTAYNAEGFGPFMRNFAAMFDGAAPVSDEDAAAMLNRLHDYFGPRWESRAFFSIPAAVGVSNPGPNQHRPDELRAVVSVGMTHEWDEKLYRDAWEFFSGVANQVLIDILATELVQHNQRASELRSVRTSYRIAHALKHRLVPVSTKANYLNAQLRKLAIDGQAKLRWGEIERLASRALDLDRWAHEASEYTQLLHLLADMLEVPDAHDIVRASIQQWQDGGSEAANSIDLGAALKVAAHRAVDITDSDQGVAIVGEFEHRVAPRLTQFPLDRHKDKEQDYCMTLFLQLLDNAASYGRAHKRSGVVLVDLQWQQSATSRGVLSLSNLIEGEESIEKARANRGGELLNRKVASGLIIARAMLQELLLGDLTYEVKETRVRGKSQFTWTSQIHLEPC